MSVKSSWFIMSQVFYFLVGCLVVLSIIESGIQRFQLLLLNCYFLLQFF